MSDNPAIADATTRRRGAAEIIIILGMLAAVGPLSVDTYLPTLPAIATEFGAASALVAQTVSAYFFGATGGQLIWGPLSDRFGRRPILFAGIALYLVASVACALAPAVAILIAARALQGFGACATLSAGRAVIRDLWAGDRAARAMSFVIMVTAFAPLIAPLLGGQIFTYLGWRAVFWMMLGFGVLLVLLVLLRLPETNGPARRAGVRVAAAFRAYGRVLVGGRGVSYLLCGGLAYATMFAYIVGSPFVYIQLFGVAPEYFGFFFGLNVIGIFIGTWLNSRYVLRFGNLRMLGTGVCVSSLGVLTLLVSALTSSGGLPAVVVGLFFAVGPVGLIGANAIAGALDFHPNNAGAASALFGVSQFGFGTIAGILVGVFDNGTPLAMALAMTIMAAGSLLALIALLVLREPATAG